jgi:hypothetical protein
MAVEDDYSTAQNSQHRQSMSISAISGHQAPQYRAPQSQQPRGPYNTYGQTDYSAYYSNAPTREPYLDYQYAYDAYHGFSDPSLYPSSAAMGGASSSNIYPGVSPQTIHPNSTQQPGLFYDYGGVGRSPGSQFYYPTHQAMMYPPPAHSPMLPSQLSNPSTLSEKKRDFQVRRVDDIPHSFS